MSGPRALAERFGAELAAVDGRPRLCESAAEALAVARELCAGSRVVLDDHPDIADLAAGLDVVDDAWDADVGVTGVAAAVADSGTLVLTAGVGTPRGTSLVPPVHVAVVPFGRLVADLGGALELVAAQRPPPSGVQLITGPSRSGDIEMRLVRGVHGPREVHVLLHPE